MVECGASFFNTIFIIEQIPSVGTIRYSLNIVALLSVPILILHDCYCTFDMLSLWEITVSVLGFCLEFPMHRYRFNANL